MIILNKVKVGIPKGLMYYYYDNFWKYFFDKLDIKVVYSPDTNIEILDRGSLVATDEMCLSLKVYLGHVDYLKDKCDYILVPRIEDYGVNNQTCTNFLGIYDLVNSLFNVKLLNYNIKDNKILDELILLGKQLNIPSNKIKESFEYANEYSNKDKKNLENKQYEILTNNNINKVLLISHSYNTYDNLIGKPIVEMLKKYNIEVIYSDLFDDKLANSEGLGMSPNLYWKYSKESIGSISLAPNIQGIIFLTSFPCGLDSLVNEFVMRKINKPYLNIIIDDISSLTGIETRIESFVDIINES